MTKSLNYTEIETQLARQLYEEKGNNGIEEIASKLGKTPNSIRAKLVREGVYIKPDKPDKIRKNGLTKKEIIRELQNLGVKPDGLEGATKGALNEIKRVIVELHNGS